MKLGKILSEREEIGHKKELPKFTSIKTGEDPETGAEEWEITYRPIFRLDTHLEKVQQEFKSVMRDHPDDPNLVKYYNKYIYFRRSLRSYITKHYGRK